MFLRKVPVRPIRTLATAKFLHLLCEPMLEAAANTLVRYDIT